MRLIFVDKLISKTVRIKIKIFFGPDKDIEIDVKM